MADKSLDDWIDETDVDDADIPGDYAERYTEPRLRWRIKEALQASGKGGDEGVWSARKAQMLAQEYERRGGGYASDERADTQRSLQSWTERDWQTSEGDAETDADSRRYLPRDAWALLPHAAAREAEATKEAANDADETTADWPDRVVRTMAELGYAEGDGLTKAEIYDRAQELEVEGRSGMDKAELKQAVLDAYRP